MQACVSSNLRRASRKLTQFYDQTLSPTGVRSTQLILLLAVYVYEPCSSMKLSRKLGMDRSTLSRNLSGLLDRYLISSRQTPGGRTKSYESTESGRRKIMEAIPYWKQAQDQVVATLGPERCRECLEHIEEMIAASQK